MGLPQMGPGGTGLSPQIQSCRPVHRSMARSVALGNRNPTDLAREYGYSKGQISRIMGSPAFQAEVERIERSAELVEMDSSINVRLMAEKAMSIVDEDMEMDPETPELRRIRQNAALEVLGIVGVRKTGGGDTYFTYNDNRQVDVEDLDEDDIRQEIIDITAASQGSE